MEAGEKDQTFIIVKWTLITVVFRLMLIFFLSYVVRLVKVRLGKVRLD